MPSLVSRHTECAYYVHGGTHEPRPGPGPTCAAELRHTWEERDEETADGKVADLSPAQRRSRWDTKPRSSPCAAVASHPPSPLWGEGRGEARRKTPDLDALISRGRGDLANEL